MGHPAQARRSNGRLTAWARTLLPTLPSSDEEPLFNRRPARLATGPCQLAPVASHRAITPARASLFFTRIPAFSPTQSKVAVKL